MSPITEVYDKWRARHQLEMQVRRLKSAATALERLDMPDLATVVRRIRQEALARLNLEVDDSGHRTSETANEPERRQALSEGMRLAVQLDLSELRRGASALDRLEIGDLAAVLRSVNDQAVARIKEFGQGRG